MPSLFEYFPNEKYVRRNWAGEKINSGVLENLAKAQRLAVKQGLLSPGLAESLLPIAMVEGHGEQLGILPHQYPPTAERDAMFNKMGLNVVDFRDVMAAQKSGGDIPQADVYKHWGEATGHYGYSAKGYWMPSGLLDRDPNRFNEVSALMMPIILAEKARRYGEENAIERWNGKGTAIEDTGYDEQFADAKNHKRKVLEAQRMLQHQKNAGLMNYYKGLLNGR